MKKRRIVSLLLAAAILAAALTGCANLRVGLMLLQHATGPYDPMDQVMEDRLNAILEAAVAQGGGGGGGGGGTIGLLRQRKWRN